MASDDFLFGEDDNTDDVLAVVPSNTAPTAGWKVLVVDDDLEVHSVTKMVLTSVQYKGQPLKLMSAYSGIEARGILEANPDIAVMLLDVVMETDDAGLRLVKVIREELMNKAVRIILRTGQPGQAPERTVIVDFDINDYKAKSELTAQKLFTSTYAALRSYEDIVTIEQNRRGLSMIIDASASLFQAKSLELFTTGVLTQIDAMIGIGGHGILCAQVDADEYDTSGMPTDHVRIMAGSGKYAALYNTPITSVQELKVRQAIATALEKRQSDFTNEYSVLYIQTPSRRDLAVFFDTDRVPGEHERKLAEVFLGKISVGFDNLQLLQQLKAAHEATVVALADLAEFKDADTGQHVLRVAGMSTRIAGILRLKGQYVDVINDKFLEHIGPASILHDVGKVATPDAVLQKPGPLDQQERRVMENHSPTGAAILQKAGKMVDGESYLAMGAEVAFTHHEWWDGSGYPRALKGEEIPLSGRIVAVADVFDALTHKRPYKEPWPWDKAIDYIKERSGTQFDPKVVDAFMEAMDN